MAETQNSKQNVQAPQAGQTVIVNAVPGQDIVLEAAFDQAEVKMDGGNVIFEFANGGQVVLNFSDIGTAQAPNVVMPDGTILNMEEFLASLGEKDVEPAAGPEGGAEGSGGVGEYRDDAGNLIDGVERLGVLDPRDFTSITVAGLEANNSLPELLGPDGVLVEDESLPEGNNEDDGGVGSVTGTIVDNVNWGTDGFGGVVSFNVGGASFAPGTTVFWGQDGAFLGTSGEGAAASLLVNGNGIYTYSLLDNLLLGQDVQGEQIDLLATVQVIGADTSGDTVSIPLVLSVQDDVPEIDVFVRSGQGYIDGNVAGGTIFGTAHILPGGEGDGSSIPTSTVDSWFFKVNSDGPVTIDTLAMEYSNSGSYIDVNGDGQIKFFDPYIYVFTNNGGIPGTLISANDDSGSTYGDGSIHSYDSFLSLYLPAGDYILVIGAYHLDEAEARLGINTDNTYPVGENWLPVSDASYKITFGGDVTITGGTNVGSGYMPMLVTQDSDTIGDAFDTATAFFAGLFGADVRMGADDPGTGPVWEFKLSLTSEDGFTGLTSGKEAIVLSFDAETGQVIGSTGSGTIFTIEVNAETGEVKLTQFAQIDHLEEDVDGVNDNSFLRLPEGSIALTGKATVVDEDGDIASDSETIDITGSIGFDDDVPSLRNVKPLVLTVDEGDILTPWSRGTTPYDGDSDGSITGGPDDPWNIKPAYVEGSLADLVSFGGDGMGRFEFTANAIAQLKALQLYSKQTALPENGQPLDYEFVPPQEGETFVILRATERDTAGRGDTSNPVFELKLYTDTGNFEFRLYDELIHVAPEEGGDKNFELRSGETGFIDTINFGAIIQAVDSDNDSVTLDGMFKIQVRDDVPVIGKVYWTGATVTHDETKGVQTDTDTGSYFVAPRFASVANPGDDPHVPGSGPIGYARSGPAIIEVSGVKVGADSPALASGYSLVVLNANSGLMTTEGNAITLSVDGAGRIIGTVVDGAHAGKVAFAVAIDSGDGEVFVAQYLSLWHPNTKNHDEAIDLGGNKIAVRYSVTDSDGDTVFKQMAMGSVVKFEDDGPSISVKASGESNYLLTTFDEKTRGENYDTASKDFSGVFSSTWNAGSDGLGNLTAMSYALGLFYGVKDSGLDSNGANVNLYKIGSAIFGSTANTSGAVDVVANTNVVFKLEVDSDGVVKLTQFQEVDHKAPGVGSDYSDQLAVLSNNLVKLMATQTITDYDGDTATDSAAIDLGGNIRFADDGPTFVGLGNLVVNGSFEEPNVNGWAYFTNGNDVPGWTNAAGNIEIQDSGAGGVAAQDGNQLLELDAHGGSNTNATVTQSIPTAHYSNLVLSFWFASRDNGGDIAATNTAEVWWNGVLLDTITDDVAGRWTQYTFKVEGNGDGSDVVLEFKGVGTDDSYGGFIDNVSVYSMPTVDEKGLRPEGSGDLLFASATLSVDFGADGPGAWTGLTLENILTTKGFAVSLEGAARFDGWYGVDEKGEDVFKVKVDLAAGTYSFTLLKQLDHDLGSDLMKLDFGFRVTDGDGDFVDGMFSVGVFDDAPIAMADVDTGEYAGNLLENDIFGADLPAKVIYVNDVGPQDDGKIVVEGKFGTLTVDSETGVYSYDTHNLADITLNNAGQDSAGYKNTFGYFIVDGNGVPNGDGHIIWTNTNTAPGLAGSTPEYTIEDVDPGSVVWFLIPNGGELNKDVAGFTNGAAINVILDDGLWKVTLDLGGAPLKGQGAPALFSDSAFNIDDYGYLTDNAFPGKLNWEDILGGGDKDNNDANIHMEVKSPGSDVFNYTVSDYDGDTASSTLTITPSSPEEPLNPPMSEFV